MKLNFLTITLLFVLAILPSAIFAQSARPQGDAETVWKEMFEQLDKRQFPQLIETATNYLRFQVPERKKMTAFDLRSLALKSVYSRKGSTVADFARESNGTFKFSDDAVEKLQLAVSDSEQVISYFTKNPPANDADRTAFAAAQNLSGNVLLDLAIFSSHNPEDFVAAEKYLRDSLNKIDTPAVQIVTNLAIIKALAGQYRFNEARELGKNLLSQTSDSDFKSRLNNITFAFVMMGEYYYAEAFCLEMAGKLKAANKPLKPVAEAIDYMRRQQITAITNPQTSMELNRQGGLHYLKNEYKQALPLLDKSMQTEGNPTALHWGIMAIFQEKMLPDEPLSVLLKNDDSDVMGLSMRGLFQGLENQLDKAIPDLSKSIGLYPELAFYYSTYDNLAKIYQAQNKPQLANEVAAKGKKLADLVSEITSPKTEKSFTESSDFLDGKKPVEGEEPRLPANKQFAGQKVQNALSDCQFILDDNGCKKYFDKSEEQISDLFGKQLKLNSYPDLGLGFYVWGDPDNGVPRTVAEVTFYNDDKKFKQFYGQPGKNLSWNATRDDLISQYGRPTKETPWVDPFADDNLPRSLLSYGQNLKIKIVNNRIAEITIRSPKHDQDLEAFYRRLREKSSDSDKQQEAKKAGEQRAKEILAIYESFHERIEAEVKRHNKLAEETKDPVVQAFPSMLFSRRNEMSKIAIKIPKMIDDFLTKYAGQLSQAMINHLKEDKAKLIQRPNR